MTLDPLELEAWRGLLTTHARVVRALDVELQAEHGIGIVAYDVLVQLDEAPGGRLRMHELADRVVLSRSGITRLVTDLERRRLVRREPAETDGRGFEAVLTPEGLELRRAAQVTHLRGVRERFHDKLTREQLEALGGSWRAILGA